jgi:hypothetical protein
VWQCDTMRRLTGTLSSCHRRNVVSARCPQMHSRVIAAATALWLVLGGVLAARHEATVAHVRDAAGNYVAGHHEDHSC